MTRYLVDTNIPSELTNPAPHPHVRQFLIRVGRDNVYASVITLGEICKGIAALAEGRKRRELRDWLDTVMRPWFADRLLPVNEQIAERWGTLTAEQRLRGRQVTMARWPHRSHRAGARFDAGYSQCQGFRRLRVDTPQSPGTDPGDRVQPKRSAVRAIPPGTSGGTSCDPHIDPLVVKMVGRFGKIQRIVRPIPFDYLLSGMMPPDSSLDLDAAQKGAFCQSPSPKS